MALGRSRNSKRQSYTSYTSTITTIVFIGLCVVGVWMLTSNSVTPQANKDTTTSVTAATTTKTSDDNNNNNDDSASSNEQQVTRSNDPNFQDNPGELPDDAIKSEDSHQSESGNNNHEDRNNGQENKSGDSLDKNENKQEFVEENAKEREKENENQSNQVSEESSMTLKEHDNGESDQSAMSETGGDRKSNDDQQQQEEEQQQQQQPEEEQQQQQQQEEQEKQGKEDEVSQSNESETAKDQLEEQKKQRNEDDVDQSKESQPSKDQQEEQKKQRKEDEGDLSNESETTTDQDKQKQQQKQEDERQEKAQSDGHESNKQSSQSDSNTHEQNPEDPQNLISEEDRQQRIEEQHNQRLEDQQKANTNFDGNTQQEPVQQELKEDKHQQEENETSKVTETLLNDRNHEQQNESHKSEEKKHDKNADGAEEDGKINESKSDGSFIGSSNSEIPKESNESKKSWKTQKSQSENQKERRQGDSQSNESIYGHDWQLCNVTAGADYIPCLDNEKALKHLHSTRHFEHRERHCPEDPPTCLVPLPKGYKRPIEWPKSRDKIWYHNVPHPMLADVKGHQNWVKVTGEFLTFPGGGTQFIHGALHYIDFLQKTVPNIKWGKHTRVILDVGCGVASFGGYLFERDVLTMSFAPKDEHEAQVQFALERGIPAISAVMGSKRLPFPGKVFDAVHCARCRVPWHAEGGTLLLELNRVLRPGGFFIWSATPVYQQLQEDVEIWNAMTELTASMCWELVTIQRDKLNHIGVAIYHKPRSNDCYDQRKQKNPPMCKDDDDPNAAWYVPLQPCMHRNPTDESVRGARWPVVWPRRLRLPPYWLNSSQMGIYGKPAPQDFTADYEHWKHVVSSSYMSGLGISWSGVRNVMDMRAVYGGFAAALKDLQMWVMNVVNIDSPDTLPIIYERGLFGIYHDWCESFSTYPRTYDLLHADHLFSKLKKRCNLAQVMAEVDRIVRPGGKIIVRDESSAIGEVENFLKSLHWEVHLTFSKNQEGILSAQKGDWRPKTYVSSS